MESNNQSTEWKLPEGAKARLGKGEIDEIALFSRWDTTCRPQ